MMRTLALAGGLALAMTTATMAQSTGPGGQSSQSANPDAAMAKQGSPGTVGAGGAMAEPRVGTTGSNANRSQMANPDASMAKSGSPGAGPSSR